MADPPQHRRRSSSSRSGNGSSGGGGSSAHPHVVPSRDFGQDLAVPYCLREEKGVPPLLKTKRKRSASLSAADALCTKWRIRRALELTDGNQTLLSRTVSLEEVFPDLEEQLRGLPKGRTAPSLRRSGTAPSLKKVTELFHRNEKRKLSKKNEEMELEEPAAPIDNIEGFPKDGASRWRRVTVSQHKNHAPSKSDNTIKSHLGIGRATTSQKNAIAPEGSAIQTPPSRVVIRGATKRYLRSESMQNRMTLEMELRQILENPEKVVIFKNFVDAEHSEEALLFWMDVEVMRKKMEINQTDAQKIIDKYFGDSSDFQLNLDADLISLIRGRLDTPSPTMFQEAQDYIFELMKNDSFRRFRKSHMYMNYLEDQEVRLLAKKMQEEASIEKIEIKKLKTSNKNILKDLNAKEEWQGDVPDDIVDVSVNLISSILSLFYNYTKTLDSPIITETTEGISRMGALELITRDPEYKKFCYLSMSLQKVNLDNVGHKEKLVFFVNIYNALSLQAILELEPPTTSSQRMKFFKTAKYKIGSYSYSMFDIEHIILRQPLSRPNFLGFIMKISKNTNDPRTQHALTFPEPFINFLLHAGTQSSPPINVYTLNNIQERMVLTAREFLSREVELQGFEGYEKNKLIKLPKVLSWYTKDFAPHSGLERDMLQAILPNFPDDLREKISFFVSTIKIKYKDYKWGYGGYMGSQHFDPSSFAEERKRATLEEQYQELTSVAMKMKQIETLEAKRMDIEQAGDFEEALRIHQQLEFLQKQVQFQSKKTGAQK